MRLKTNMKFFIATLFVGVLLYVVYVLPEPEYEGKALTAEVFDAVPVNTSSWRGRDLAEAGERFETEIYSFLSRILVREYIRPGTKEPSILFIVLDAGNFHYPANCFRGAGFSSDELPREKLDLKAGELKVNLIHSKKSDEEFLTIYWIAIDQELVSSWAQQKVKQLYYSLFSRDRVGLMVRLDIPVTSGLKGAIFRAEDLLDEVYEAVPEEYRSFLFSDLRG